MNEEATFSTICQQMAAIFKIMNLKKPRKIVKFVQESGAPSIVESMSIKCNLLITEPAGNFHEESLTFLEAKKSRIFLFLFLYIQYFRHIQHLIVCIATSANRFNYL